MLKLGWILMGATPLFAQTYTIVENNSMFGQPMTMTVYRNGTKAVVENVVGAQHTRSLYDLAAHTQQSWDASAASPLCSNGTFGDWGDPYAMAADLMGEMTKQHGQKSGSDVINNVPVDVYEAAISGGKAKVWFDAKSKLVMRMQMAEAGAPLKTVLEVTKVTMTPPPASLFVVPASCTAAAAAAPPPQKIALDFVKAIMPPAAKGGSCSVIFRVMKGDPADATSLTPVTAGFKMQMGATADAPLQDVSAQVRNGVYRIDNAPEVFNLGVDFNGGGSFGLIYRQCISPQTVLLLIVKNPAKVTDGADWFWVKSDKFKP